jgi:hypothetical protein
MFNWFYNLFGQNKTDDDQYNQYVDYINYCSKNNKNELIGNFSADGFYEIFKTLIEISKDQMFIFIKNYESVFTDELFQYFKFNLKRHEKNLSEVCIMTFDGVIDKRFKNLDTEFNCFNYYAMRIKNGCPNNFIVVDNKAYWIEEDFTSLRRTGFESQPFKACCNFNDPFKSSRLIKIFLDCKK